MISDLRRDSNGDVVIPFTLVYGLTAVGQMVTRRLRSWRREWKYNLLYGLPYRDTIFVKNPRPGIVKAAILTEVKKVRGVNDIRDYTESLDRLTRVLTVEFTVVTSEGSLQFALGLGNAAFTVLFHAAPMGIV